MSIALEILQGRRDDLLRQVWVVMNDISKEKEALRIEPIMTEEDSAVWAAVTGHSSIQRRLDEAQRKRQEHAKTT